MILETSLETIYTAASSKRVKIKMENTNPVNVLLKINDTTVDDCTLGEADKDDEGNVKGVNTRELVFDLLEGDVIYGQASASDEVTVTIS